LAQLLNFSNLKLTENNQTAGESLRFFYAISDIANNSVNIFYITLSVHIFISDFSFIYKQKFRLEFLIIIFRIALIF